MAALAGTPENGRLRTFAAERHTACNHSTCVSALATGYLTTDLGTARAGHRLRERGTPGTGRAAQAAGVRVLV